MGCGSSSEVATLREENHRLQEFAKEQQARASAAEKELRLATGKELNPEDRPRGKFRVENTKTKEVAMIEMDLEKQAYSLCKKVCGKFGFEVWEADVFRDYKDLRSKTVIIKEGLGEATTDKKKRTVPALTMDPCVKKNAPMSEVYPPNKNTTGPVTVELPRLPEHSEYRYKECQVRPTITVQELHDALVSAYPDHFKNKKRWDMWLVTRQRHENFRLGSGFYAVDAYLSYEPAGDANTAVIGQDLELKDGAHIYVTPKFDPKAFKAATVADVENTADGDKGNTAGGKANGKA